MAHFKVDRKNSPKYVIEFEDGTLHQVDPMDILFELQAAGLDKVATPDKKQRQILKDIFGLPSFSTTDIFGVLNGFHSYMEKTTKEIDWMAKLSKESPAEATPIDVETAKLLEKFPIENSNVKV